MNSNDQLTLFFEHTLFSYLSYINVSQKNECIHNTQTHTWIYTTYKEIKEMK
jgi:hypothetical protein